MWRRGKENSAHPTHVISKGRLVYLNIQTITLAQPQLQRKPRLNTHHWRSTWSSITFPSSCIHHFPPKVSQNETCKENSTTKGRGNGMTEGNAMASVRVRRFHLPVSDNHLEKTNKQTNSNNKNRPLSTNPEAPLSNQPSGGLEEAVLFLQGVPAPISKLLHCPITRVLIFSCSFEDVLRHLSPRALSMLTRLRFWWHNP